MGDHIQFMTRISGDQDIARRFIVKGDALRLKVRAAIRRLGQEMQADARARAPHKTGKLRQSIRTKIRASNADAISLSIRPTAFYGLFIEHGWTKAPFRRGNRKVDGSYGADRRVVVNRGRQRDRQTGQVTYAGFVDRSERNSSWRSRGAFREKTHRVKAYTYKKTTKIAGRPYMAPMWETFKGQIQERIDAAVREALRG